MKLIDLLLESHLYYYGWIDADGVYHEGGHTQIMQEAFYDQIVSDMDLEGRDPHIIKNKMNLVPDSDFYLYGFSNGWVRVYTEGGEIGFQLGLEPSREAVRKVYEIIKDRFDYKIMLQIGQDWGRFDDPRQAQRWLNQRYRGVITEAVEIPGTDYGYWITDRGEFIPVGFENHEAEAEGYFPHYNPDEHGMAGGLALKSGWIRVVETDDGLGFGWSIRNVTRLAIYRMLILIKDSPKKVYRIDEYEGGSRSFYREVDVNTFVRDLLKSKLNEAPLGDFQVDPDLEQNLATQRRKWHGYEREKQHFSDRDVKAIRDPEVIRKIATKFARIPQNLNLYFWANPDPDYDWHTQKGEVRLDWISERMGPDVAQRISRLNNARNRINIIHTGNLRDEAYVPMRSPWMMAHRTAHVLTQGYEPNIHGMFDKFVESLTRRAYGVEWPKVSGWNREIFRRDYFRAYGKLLGHMLGRMNSARKGKLVQYAEWVYERFTQYLMTGRVRLNRQLPRRLDRDHTLRPGAEQFTTKLIARFEHQLEQAFEKVLNQSVGKYYVM